MASFEEKLSSLETVVERLERGELSLDDSVRLFEQGVLLSNSCKAELEKAEGRIQVLVETAGGGVKVAELDVEDEEFAGDDDEADDDEAERFDEK